MTALVFFCLATAGLTGIVVEGSIFDTPRNWLIRNARPLGQLVTCYQCSGFWAGLACGLMLDPVPTAGPGRWPAYALAGAILGPVVWVAINAMRAIASKP